MTALRWSADLTAAEQDAVQNLIRAATRADGSFMIMTVIFLMVGLGPQYLS